MTNQTTITHAEVRDDGVIDLRDDNDMLVGLIRLSAVESITVDWNILSGRARIRTTSGAEHIVMFNSGDGGEAAISLMTDLTRSTPVTA